MFHPMRLCTMLLVLLAISQSVACAGASPAPTTPPTAELTPGQPLSRIVFQSPPFERLAEDGGVVVYADSSSDLIRVGAEGRFPAPPEQVLAALLDFPRHAKVLDRVSESRTIAEGPNWLRLYQRLSLPVISDRDFTLQVTWGERDGWRWIRYRATRKGPAPLDGVVRVTHNHGGWDLLPTDSGKATLARYQSNLDLAGSLPTWMSRPGAIDELPSLFLSMCGLLPESYAQACTP